MADPIGTEGDDELLGGPGNDSLEGLGGDDTLFGGDGHDLLYGGDGDDTLFAGWGYDVLYGGVGDDLLVGGPDGSDLYGGSGDDTLQGGQGNNVIDGGGGDDTLIVRPEDLSSTMLFLQGGEGVDTVDLSAVLARPGLTHDLRYDGGSATDGVIVIRGPDGAELHTVVFSGVEAFRTEVICFTPGTLVTTARGDLPVERLRPGERVLTRDDGWQELAWAGRRDLEEPELAAQPHLAPVLVRAGALGGGLPERDLLVSPQHRVLIAGAPAQLHFAEAEVLVAAKHLTGRPGVERVRPAGVAYLHLMFERHQVIRSNGAWTESFQPGDGSLRGLGPAQREEVLDLFPALASPEGRRSYAAARAAVRGAEAGVLVKDRPVSAMPLTRY